MTTEIWVIIKFPSDIDVFRFYPPYEADAVTYVDYLSPSTGDLLSAYVMDIHKNAEVVVCSTLPSATTTSGSTMAFR